MTRPHLKLFTAVIAVVLSLATPALAQPKSRNHDPGRSDDAKQNDAAFDRQFRAEQNNPQAAAAKSDPWGGVRSEPAQPAAAAAKKPKK
jgi:hypothetical protein